MLFQSLAGVWNGKYVWGKLDPELHPRLYDAVKELGGVNDARVLELLDGFVRAYAEAGEAIKNENDLQEDVGKDNYRQYVHRLLMDARAYLLNLYKLINNEQCFKVMGFKTTDQRCYRVKNFQYK